MDSALVESLQEILDELTTLKSGLRQRYRESTRQVTAKDFKEIAGRIAERWLTRLGRDQGLIATVGEDLVADLTVHFQRLLVSSEKAAQRRTYDAALTAIIKQFRTSVIIPVKAAVSGQLSVAPKLLSRASAPQSTQSLSVFLAHSFDSEDIALVTVIRRLFEALGMEVITGERPRAGSISEKVRERIERCDIFVGLFTPRDKLSGTKVFNTSVWVVDEKAYASARGKRLILIKESSVASIGGIQGDYEYMEFTKDTFPELLVKIVELFSFTEVLLN